VPHLVAHAAIADFIAWPRYTLTMITIETLALWADRLARMATGTRTDVVALLELHGELEVRRDYTIVRAPMPGISEILLFENIRKREQFDRVEIAFTPPTITLAELDARFGDGAAAPRAPSSAKVTRRYQLDPTGTPCLCRIFASFAIDPPAPTTPAFVISLGRIPREWLA
jgi:hypothetical protein